MAIAHPVAMRSDNCQREEFEKKALVYLDEIYQVALKYTHNRHDAEDLVQETILRAYRAWPSFAKDTRVQAWLLTILTNTFISRYRRGRTARRFAAKPTNELLGSFYGEETRARAERPEQAWLSFGDEVRHALDELSEEHRIVILLADVEELSYREIASILKLPPGTVMSRLFRARRHLEERLGAFAEVEYGIVRNAA